jgi:hypothetical protein
MLTAYRSTADNLLNSQYDPSSLLGTYTSIDTNNSELLKESKFIISISGFALLLLRKAKFYILPTQYVCDVCVSYDTRNKCRLFPRTAVIGWPLTESSVFS